VGHVWGVGLERVGGAHRTWWWDTIARSPVPGELHILASRAYEQHCIIGVFAAAHPMRVKRRAGSQAWTMRSFSMSGSHAGNQAIEP